MSSADTVDDRWDNALTALTADPRRRLVVSLRDLPPDRRAILPEAAHSPVTDPDRERLEISLKQHHLPLLADNGYVEWTEEPFRASRGPHFDDGASIIGVIHARSDSLPDRLVDGCDRLDTGLTSD